MEIQRCQRVWFLKSRLLYAGFYCIDNDKTEPSMSSHPGGRKTPSCLLNDGHGKRDKGVRDWKEGGEGGVGNLIPCY